MEPAPLCHVVAGLEPRTVVPPLFAAEEQVRAWNNTHTGGLSAMPLIHRDRERLRRHDATKLRGLGEVVVPVDRVGIVHGHHPATNVGRRAWLDQLASADFLPDATLHIP